MRSFHHNTMSKQMLPPGSVSGSVQGPAVEFPGARFLAILLNCDTLTGVSASTIVVEESDDGSNWTPVPSDEDPVGEVAFRGIAAATPYADAVTVGVLPIKETSGPYYRLNTNLAGSPADISAVGVGYNLYDLPPAEDHRNANAFDDIVGVKARQTSLKDVARP